MFVLGLVLLLGTNRFAWAQSSNVQYFAETGHFVRDSFLDYFKSAGDPLLIFGYPITEQMTSRDGLTVQYFQKARFERVIDTSGVPHIQVSAIGRALYQPGKQQNISNPLACQFFAKTGYSVCFQFLDFYRNNHGTERFGEPISPFEFHDDLLVQYFEYARFEWRTDGFNGRVVLTDLGRIYFDVFGEDRSRLDSILPEDATINPVLAIRVRAFVSKPITRSSGEQTVFVIVTSQTDQALANATGTATIRLADGSLQAIEFATDSRGVAQFMFSFNNQVAGEVVPIEVVVRYQTLSGRTRASFRVWY